MNIERFPANDVHSAEEPFLPHVEKCIGSTAVVRMSDYRFTFVYQDGKVVLVDTTHLQLNDHAGEKPSKSQVAAAAEAAKHAIEKNFRDAELNAIARGDYDENDQPIPHHRGGDQEVAE